MKKLLITLLAIIPTFAFPAQFEYVKNYSTVTWTGTKVINGDVELYSSTPSATTNFEIKGGSITKVTNITVSGKVDGYDISTQFGAVSSDTNTLRTNINSIAADTGTLKNLINQVAIDTAAIDFTGLKTDTGTLRTDLNAIAVSTGFLSTVSTITYMQDMSTITYMVDMSTIEYMRNLSTVTYMTDLSTITYMRDLSTITYVVDLSTLDYVSRSSATATYLHSVGTNSFACFENVRTSSVTFDDGTIMVSTAGFGGSVSPDTEYTSTICYTFNIDSFGSSISSTTFVTDWSGLKPIYKILNSSFTMTKWSVYSIGYSTCGSTEFVVRKSTAFHCEGTTGGDVLTSGIPPYPDIIYEDLGTIIISTSSRYTYFNIVGSTLALNINDAFTIAVTTMTDRPSGTPATWAEIKNITFEIWGYIKKKLRD